MKYLVIHNDTDTREVRAPVTQYAGGAGGGDNTYVTNSMTLLTPFDDYQEAYNFSKENGGYVVKLVEPEIKEKA